jgi:hypothetical protein
MNIHRLFMYDVISISNFEDHLHISSLLKQGTTGMILEGNLCESCFFSERQMLYVRIHTRGDSTPPCGILFGV